MMESKKRRFVSMTVCAAVIAAVGVSMAAWTPVALAAAQKGDYPAKGKSIQMIVNYAAGGSTDVGARIAAGAVEKILGTKVEVVNKPGASGQIGATFTSQAKPDGYTIGAVNLPVLVVTYLDASRKAVYSRKDFMPLALQVVDPGLIAVKADSPYKTLTDVINAAKANPKKITITTTGLQSGEHFMLMNLQNLTNAQFAMVHFSEGSAAAVMAVLGGKVDVLCVNVSDVTPHVKSGAVRMLGVMDTHDSPFVPGKTFTAQGIPLVVGTSRGFALPKGTPKEIVDVLDDAMKKAMESEDVKEKMFKMGLTWRYMNAVEFTKYWDDIDATMQKVLPQTKQ